MSETRKCPEGEALVAFLYDEADFVQRARVEAHLAGCSACRSEMEALRGVRGTLAEWKAPAAALGYRLVRDPVVVPIRRPWYSVPRWALAAAAVLLLAAAAAVANLDVRYGDDGLVVRTGWQERAEQAAPPADAARAAWRSDLAALERQLRSEIRTAAPAGLAALASGAARATPPMTDAAFASRVDEALRSGRVRSLPAAASEQGIVRKVEEMIRASEERQRRELALRLATVSTEVAEAQRRREAELLRFVQYPGQGGGTAFGVRRVNK